MAKAHQWTVPQIRKVAALWAQDVCAEAIADSMMADYGVFVTKNAVIALARRNRSLMPEKTGRSCFTVRSAGRRRANVLSGGAA